VSFEGQEDWVKAESGGVFTSLLPPTFGKEMVFIN
jgi:hypothetical protein